MNTYVGYQKITADGAVNASAKPVAIWGIYIESTANGAASVSFYDGTSTSGTKIMTISGVADGGFEQVFSRGRVFPSGCFVDVDTNTSFVTVWYETLS